MSQSFFQNLGSFSDFSELTEDIHFHHVPADWCVIITDVKSSTAAIEAGAYKDVNTVGAAAIVVVQNTLEEIEFPYSFGGDGARILIPREARGAVARKLAALKNLSARNFGLELRVGMLDVSEVVDDAHTIEVAKFELIAGRSVAVFRGGGLSRAEKLLKEEPQAHEIETVESMEVDLNGLSCRWNSIPNEHGCILSLIVLARENGAKEVYPAVLKKLDEVMGRKLEEANPVNPERMSYKSVSELSRDERRYHGSFSFAWVRRYLEILFAVLIIRTKAPIPGFQPEDYSRSMRTHSDYRKFDDMLRLIIDCSIEQAEEIRNHLEVARRRGEIYYGLHQSVDSLMTCFVEGIGDGRHVHFIDGGNGGYAMAAKQLKSQQGS